MPVADHERKCTECGMSLKGRQPQTKSCSPKCRQARLRRIKRQETRAAIERSPVLTELEADVLSEVLKEEARPIVREALTADVIVAINDLIALTPTAVAAIKMDLTGDDPAARGRAYTQLLRYTVGHGALLQPENQSNAPITVVFPGMARPDGVAAPVAPPASPVAIDATAEEIVEDIRRCNACGREAPGEEFVGKSDRCLDCHTKMQARLKDLVDA